LVIPTKAPLSGESAMQQLCEYEIVDELGNGSVAGVHRARDTVLAREVALKVLHLRLLTTQHKHSQVCPWTPPAIE
jgi:hypothetical protein